MFTFRLLVTSMQSKCLEGLGGEKGVDALSQETTLIQQIFGGRLRSKVFIELSTVACTFHVESTFSCKIIDSLVYWIRLSPACRLVALCASTDRL